MNGEAARRISNEVEKSQSLLFCIKTSSYLAIYFSYKISIAFLIKSSLTEMYLAVVWILLCPAISARTLMLTDLLAKADMKLRLPLCELAPSIRHA